MDRAVNESLEKLKAELADSLEENLPEVTKHADDPVAFNAAVAKLIGKNLKKDAGASAIRQNYKGTGKQAHRRQLYISIGDAASVDVWLDSGYVNIGGVISPPKGHESKKMMGDMTPEQVYQWLSGTLKKMYAGFVKEDADVEFTEEELLDEGKGLRVGTVRTWKSGKYQKTSTGWVPVEASVKTQAGQAAKTSAPQNVGDAPTKEHFKALRGKQFVSGGQYMNMRALAARDKLSADDIMSLGQLKHGETLHLVGKALKLTRASDKVREVKLAAKQNPAPKDPEQEELPHGGGTLPHRFQDGACVYCGKKEPKSKLPPQVMDPELTFDTVMGNRPARHAMSTAVHALEKRAALLGRSSARQLDLDRESGMAHKGGWQQHAIKAAELAGATETDLFGLMKHALKNREHLESVRIVDAHRDTAPNALEALRLEAAAKKAKVIAITGWKKVADMDNQEVINLAGSLAYSARMARQYGEGTSSKDSVRFREAMQRIKDEGMMDSRDEDDLWNQYRGERGY